MFECSKSSCSYFIGVGTVGSFRCLSHSGRALPFAQIQFKFLECLRFNACVFRFCAYRWLALILFASKDQRYEAIVVNFSALLPNFIRPLRIFFALGKVKTVQKNTN